MGKAGAETTFRMDPLIIGHSSWPDPATLYRLNRNGYALGQRQGVLVCTVCQQRHLSPQAHAMNDLTIHVHLDSPVCHGSTSRILICRESTKFFQKVRDAF